MSKYLIFISEEVANADLQFVNETLGFPDNNGTDTWDIIQKAYNKDIWYFLLPDGMSGKMMATDISEYLKPINLELL